MTDLPTPDPAAGEAAAQEAAQARQDIEAKLGDGSMTLTDLFGMSDQESGDSHRVAGHMHVKAALIALPHIDEVRANEILDAAGVAHDHHIDAVGSEQRSQIETAAASYTGESE
jgi:hypothetical protein